jgi:hypothetical protein
MGDLPTMSDFKKNIMGDLPTMSETFLKPMGDFPTIKTRNEHRCGFLICGTLISNS